MAPPVRSGEQPQDAVAPDLGHFADLAKYGTAAHAPLPWASDDLRGPAAPTLLVLGDTDFLRVEHAAEMRDLVADARPAVLPDTTHMALMRLTALLLPMPEEFLG
ncbi:hypothetical protein ACIQU3_04395 [Streptomyces sp. NPDC101110]|uniref:hypothetical protein n=1 Tax=unclassified Streptomyces TaxID=2593676 RepID=UPI00382012A8